MKPILLIAAFAALLFALPAQAGHVATTTCCVPQQVVLAAAPVVVQAVPQVVLQTQVIETQAVVTTQAVTYQVGERRLRLGERLRNNLAQRKANRTARVATLEPVQQAATVQTLGVECEGLED